MSAASKYTPPLGYHVLTPLYDRAIALLTRERVWRTDLVDAIAPLASEFIVDVGSGTGSLALALRKTQAQHIYLGIDPDENAVKRARKKLSPVTGVNDFHVGYFRPESLEKWPAPTKLVSSLVLHQVPLDEKSRILKTMYDALSPGGLCIIADYGRQSSRLSKALFRMSVQTLDGTENTQPNADGIIPKLLETAGFVDVVEEKRIATLTGVISLYRGIKKNHQMTKGD